MAQFWEFFTFELKLRAKSLSTYVYFVLFFSLSFMAMAVDDFFSTGNDKVLLNGPFSTSLLYFIFSFFGCIIIAAIFGTSILRDFQRDTYQIIFTKPITKFAYLGGRWFGSFITTVCIFFGLVLGEAAGTLAPWADHARIAHGAFHWYFHAFFLITVVQIFFLGSIFFTIAALTRKLFVVYLQGVAFFVVYLIINAIFSATRSLEHFWSAIFDPVGLRLVDAVTRYWTPVEQNTLQFHLSGVFLYNRLVWISVGVISLIVVYTLFPLSVETLTSVSQGRRAARERENDAATAKTIRSLVAKRLPIVHQVFNGTTTFEQFVSLTRIRIKNIFTELPFWAIFAVMVMYAMLLGHFAGRANDGKLYPVTFLMLDAVRGNSFVLLIVVATLYAGELVWRERDTHFDGIHDALSHARIHRLALQARRTRRHRAHPPHRRHALRHPLADLRRLLPLRAHPIHQRALHRHLPASPHLHLLRALSPDHSQEQVHRPRHRHRQLRPARCSPGPWLGGTPSISSATRPAISIRT